MKLLIDIGNTRIKVGWLEPGSGRREHQPLTLEHNAVGQFPAWLAQLNERPGAVLGVSVARPELSAALDAILTQHYGLASRWVQGQPLAAGVRNAYRHEQLGTDRWVSMLGLAQHALKQDGGDSPLMLASFGTATTLDTLRPLNDSAADQAHPNDGARFVFEGGLIFPGPALMRTSLAAGTARLPEADGPAHAYPVDTQQAISSGIAAAQAGALLRQWREGLERYGHAPIVFSSGGGWPGVQDEAQRLLARAQADLHLPLRPIQWLATPVLDGLARLAQEPDQ
ncbi:type III pantothenate kinase [Pollutimonas harenae]|uniref:Type III pantothenate kinase n=1 Tax=Pollutimonas harenae TaxID=657015 RepID=A0A853GZ08_9BURK|nr:type III pantothenate kinase [Pollutimonas harenae]NYT84295.1 type III pantothenate kinase [Pollutimonas harenae]TEA73299.1 type III pantothenate kinase [Pollutimonas harenae]